MTSESPSLTPQTLTIITFIFSLRSLYCRCIQKLDTHEPAFRLKLHTFAIQAANMATSAPAMPLNCAVAFELESLFLKQKHFKDETLLFKGPCVASTFLMERYF